MCLHLFIYQLIYILITPSSNPPTTPGTTHKLFSSVNPSMPDLAMSHMYPFSEKSLLCHEREKNARNGHVSAETTMSVTQSEGESCYT